MLVLSRKENQRIVIGENSELVVVALSGDRVKLGFNAPRDVQIHREEAYRRIHSENGAAAADGQTTGDNRGTGCDDHHVGDLATVAALVEAKMVLADLRQAEDG